VCDDEFERPTRLHTQFLDEPTRFGRMVGRSARAADVDRIHFYRLLWKHGLREHTPEKPTESSGE
jgi:hypothetical protein